MRVLLTTDTVGGVWTFTKELATGLLERGHAVALASFGADAAESQLLWCAATARSFGGAFRYVGSAVPLEWMQANEAAYADGEPVLLRLADEFGAEIFHTSQFCFGRLPLRIPKVVTAHSDVLSWARACKGGRLEDSDWLDRYCALVQDGLAGADAVAAPTRWMLEALRGGFAFSGPEHVIYNGRDVHPPERTERKMQAVSVGRMWDEAKNLRLLAGAFLPVPVMVAGVAANGGTQAHGSGGGLTMLGQLAEDDVLRLFRESSMYLAPSRYEPFGLAALEAALCGCAVIAMDLPSFREVWGDAAIFFSNETELSTCVQALCDSPDALAGAQGKARCRALEFSRGRMTEAYLALYGEMAGSPADTPRQAVLCGS